MSSSKLLNLCRKKDFFWKRGSLFSSCSSIIQSATHQILPANPPSFAPRFASSSEIRGGASPADSIVKQGMDGNIRKVIITREYEKCLDEMIIPLMMNGRFDRALYMFKAFLIGDRDLDMQQQWNHFIKYLLEDDRIIRTIVSLIENKMVEECVMLFDELLEHLDGTPPFDLDFYAIVIQFLVRANEPYKVDKLLKIMKASGHDPSHIEKSPYCEPYFYEIYQNVVSAFCHLWRFDDAARFVEEQLSQYSSFGYDRLFLFYCAAGKLDDADFLLDKIVKNYGGLDCYCLWEYLTRRFCLEDEIDKAFALLKRTIADIYKRPDAVLPPSHRKSLLGTIVKSSRKIHPNGRHEVFGLAVYIMSISGVWKEAQKIGQNGIKQPDKHPDVTRHGADYPNASRLENGNEFLENMIKKGADNIDLHATLITELCGKGQLDKAFETLKSMIALWDQEHTSVFGLQTSTHQTSTCDKLVPNSNPSPSLSDVIMSSLSRSRAKGDDAFLSLAVYAMLSTRVWKEGLKIDTTIIGPDGGIQMPELSPISPFLPWKEYDFKPPEDLCQYI